MVLGRRPASSIARLQQIAAVYEPIAPLERALVPDFHSVRQALNVASADQRVLVVIHGSMVDTNPLRDSLRQVSNHAAIVGRFHFDFDDTQEWKTAVSGLSQQSGIAVIRPGEFGMKGAVMMEFSLSTKPAELIAQLVSANQEFAATTARKVYAAHVSRGQKLGVYFEGAVPYGEDRDGDGQVDRGGRLPGFGGRSRGPSGRPRTLRP